MNSLFQSLITPQSGKAMPPNPVLPDSSLQQLLQAVAAKLQPEKPHINVLSTAPLTPGLVITANPTSTPDTITPETIQWFQQLLASSNALNPHIRASPYPSPTYGAQTVHPITQPYHPIATTAQVHPKPAVGDSHDVLSALSSALGAETCERGFQPSSPHSGSDATPKLLCAFWYHYGGCRNDPNNSAYSGSRLICRYMHGNPGMDDVQCQILPRKIHPHDCHLVKCPWSSNYQGTQYFQERHARHASNAGMGGQKRKANDMGYVERDNGESRPTTDVPQTQPSDGPETCFFWLHGDCKRTKDPGGCNHAHHLIDPPAMVQPPPGYKHRRPCHLKWCPGDYIWVDAGAGKKGKVLGDAEKGASRKKYKHSGKVGDAGSNSHKEFMNSLTYSEGLGEIEESEENVDDGESQAKWHLDGFPERSK